MNINLSEEQIANYIDEIDVNKDGEVDFQEFQVMVGKEWFTTLWNNQMTIELQRALSHQTHPEYEDEEQSTSDDGGDDDDEDDRKESVSPLDGALHSSFGEQQIESLKDRLTEREDEIADLKRRLTERAGDEKEEDKFLSLQMERDSAIDRASEMEQRIHRLRNDNERSQTHIQGLNSENVRMKQELAAMRRDFTETRGTADAEHEMVETTKMDMDRINNEKMMLRSEMSRISVNFETVRSEMEILRDQNRDLRDEICFGERGL